MDSDNYDEKFREIDLSIAELRRAAGALKATKSIRWKAKYQVLKSQTLKAIDAIPDGEGIPDWYYLEKGWEIPK